MELALGHSLAILVLFFLLCTSVQIWEHGEVLFPLMPFLAKEWLRLLLGGNCVCVLSLSLCAVVAGDIPIFFFY